MELYNHIMKQLRCCCLVLGISLLAAIAIVFIWAWLANGG